MLCSIADVYDAMRSQRKYQQAFPTDRILAVLKRNDGTQFDQHLVRRFVQLIGIYPAGNLVRLNTGEIASCCKVYAPDPYRPQVRVLFGRDGRRLDLPYELNLWDATDDGRTALVGRRAAGSRRLRRRSADADVVKTADRVDRARAVDRAPDSAGPRRHYGEVAALAGGRAPRARSATSCGAAAGPTCRVIA